MSVALRMVASSVFCGTCFYLLLEHRSPATDITSNAKVDALVLFYAVVGQHRGLWVAGFLSNGSSSVPTPRILPA